MSIDSLISSPAGHGPAGASKQQPKDKAKDAAAPPLTAPVVSSAAPSASNPAASSSSAATMPQDVVTVSSPSPAAATQAPSEIKLVPVVAAPAPSDEPPSALPPAAPAAPLPAAAPAAAPSAAAMVAAAPAAPIAAAGQGSPAAHREAARLYHAPDENPRLATAHRSEDGQANGAASAKAAASPSAVQDVVSVNGKAGSVARPDDPAADAAFNLSALQLKLYDPRQWVAQWAPSSIASTSAPTNEPADDLKQLSFTFAQPFSDQPRASEPKADERPAKSEFELPWPIDDQKVA